MNCMKVVQCERADRLRVTVHMYWQDTLNFHLREDVVECREHGHSVLRTVSSPAP